MRLKLGVLGLVLALAALAAQPAIPAVGSVDASMSASNIATCDGTSTVSLTITGVEPPPAQRHLDVELVLDESGSVSATDFNTMKSGAQTFANNLLTGNNELGLTMFSTTARVIFHPTLNRTSAVNAIGTVTQLGGFTAIGAGLQTAQGELTTFGRTGVQKAIILETDGQNNRDPDPITVANTIKASGTVIFAVGIGSAVNTTELNNIASSIPGVQTVYTNPNYATLASTLQTIAGTIEVPAATAMSYHATAAPGFEIVGAAADRGTIGHTLTDVSWSLPQLGAETVHVTYQLHHTGSLDGAAIPINSTADLHWTDDGGAAQSESFADQAISVHGCNQAPIADAGPDQVVDLSGSPIADVSMDASGSTDDGQPGPLTYTWDEAGNPLGTGVNPTISLGLGVHEINVTVSDGELSDSDSMFVTVRDPSPPVITPHVVGTLGSNGWYTSDVGVSFDVSEPESGPATMVGCGSQTVNADTLGASFLCEAFSAGGAASATVDVKRDATTPDVHFSGNAGTYALNDTVNITCSATDAMSGIATSTCPEAHGPAWTFAASNTLNASATDNAGNSASASTTFTVQASVAGLCGLVGQWVDGAGNQTSLCQKLTNAAAAKARGDLGAYSNILNAFALQLQALSGKKISAANAQTLIDLSHLL